jgi:hypothetical protein
MRLKTIEFGLEALFFVKEGNDLGFLELRQDLVIGSGIFERLLRFRDSTVVVEKESSEFRMLQSNRHYPYKHTTLYLYNMSTSYIMRTTQRNVTHLISPLKLSASACMRSIRSSAVFFSSSKALTRC